MGYNFFEHTKGPKNENRGEDAAAGIEEGLDALVEEMYPLGNVAQTFRELLVERARLKRDLQDIAAPPVNSPDPLRFHWGVPLLIIEVLIDGIEDTHWAMCAERLMPVMEKSFPKTREELRIIAEELLEHRLNPRTVLRASDAGLDSENAAVASRLRVSLRTLSFSLGQLAKPLIEKTCWNLSPLAEQFSWGKGYCPVCGAMPELAFLDQNVGRRWLRCSSCSHEWPFTLLMCPFCESENHDDFEFYFPAGREYESIDVCHKCKRYVPIVDLRKWPNPAIREVASLAVMHLDMIAQAKGFYPAAVCAWNFVRDREVYCMPAQQNVPVLREMTEYNASAVQIKR